MLESKPHMINMNMMKCLEIEIIQREGSDSKKGGGVRLSKINQKVNKHTFTRNARIKSTHDK